MRIQTSRPTATRAGKGNDKHYMGSAWTGRHFDPVIAAQAVQWLETTAGASDRPWFLTIALVNPHDVMWYPIDQAWYAESHPDESRLLEAMQEMALGDFRPDKLATGYAERFDRLPANFDDDLHSKPEVQRAWRQVRNTEHFVGRMDHADTRSWLRQLDYYAWLHEELDTNVKTVLDALDRLGCYDDTVIVLTSDHGDACGAHGLRAKLPCVYEEVMGVPLIVKVPESTRGGESTDALATHVDLATTLCALGGVLPAQAPSLAGSDLRPVFADPKAAVREAVLFAQDSAQSKLIRNSRYAVRGFFDGTTKYARYYGIGGGVARDGTVDAAGKLFGPDAGFDDHDHEWYEAAEDPHEMVNLAHDPSRKQKVRELFHYQLELERDAFEPASS